MRLPGRRRFRGWTPRISGATTLAKAEAACRETLFISLSALQPVTR